MEDLSQIQNTSQVRSGSDSETNLEKIEEKLLLSLKLNHNGQLNEAEQVLAETIEEALKYYKDDLNFGMAAYYFEYGSLLLKKLESSTDIFGENVNDAKKEQSDDEDAGSEEGDNNQNQGARKEESKAETQTANQNEQKQVIYQDQSVEILDEKTEQQIDGENLADNNNENNNIDDLQIAFENLEAAQKILSLEIEQKSNQAAKLCDLRQQKAKVHTRIGDLQCWRDDMKQAILEYEEGLQLRKLTETSESRDLSESYFLLGNALLYDNQDGCQSQAIHNYLNSAQVLENILTLQLNINPVNIIAHFKSPEDLPRDRLRFGFLDDEETKDMKSIISSLYDKIEDTWMQRNEKDKVKVETERMKEVIANSSNKFTTIGVTSENGEPRQIINLGVVGSAAIKRKMPVPVQSESESSEKIIKQVESPLKEGNQKENEKENNTMVVNNVIIKTVIDPSGTGAECQKKIKLD